MDTRMETAFYLRPATDDVRAWARYEVALRAACKAWRGDRTASFWRWVHEDLERAAEVLEGVDLGGDDFCQLDPWAEAA